MGVYYFPACGFGFWYLLGKYQQLKKSEDDIYIGSSAGSLICVCSLIDTKYKFFETIVDYAFESLYEYKRTTYTINLYTLVSIFLDNLEAFIDREKLMFNLTRLRIQITEINDFCVKKHQIQPQSWSHLKQLCIASCYIPLLSNYNYGLRYTVDGINCVDGFIADLYYPNLFRTFDVCNYRGLSIPSRERLTKMYLTGLNESNKEEFCWMIHPFYIITLFVLLTATACTTTFH
jgi:hypothetical protein